MGPKPKFHGGPKLTFGFWERLAHIFNDGLAKHIGFEWIVRQKTERHGVVKWAGQMFLIPLEGAG